MVGYLLQLRQSSEATHKINSHIHSLLSFVLQIILTQHHWHLWALRYSIAKANDRVKSLGTSGAIGAGINHGQNIGKSTSQDSARGNTRVKNVVIDHMKIRM